ncbi:MAG: hypothetical protein ABIL68_10145 [bacterium]
MPEILYRASRVGIVVFLTLPRLDSRSKHRGNDRGWDVIPEILYRESRGIWK